MVYQSKADLHARITHLENSKAAFLARLEATPDSFRIIADVSDVERDGVLTHFTLGGDVARVTVDAIGDRVTLAPLRRADQYQPVVISLQNETPEVDFDERSASRVLAVYEAFRDGPKPTGAELAAGLNRHVAS